MVSKKKSIVFAILHGIKRFAVARVLFATVAQSVEQLIRNQQVAGSSPASSSRKISVCGFADRYFFINSRLLCHERFRKI